MELSKIEGKNRCNRTGDSLNQIKEVAKSDSRIELIEFEYFHQDELEGILRKNRYDVTQWIFSGQTPYYYALDNGWITEEEAVLYTATWDGTSWVRY